VTNPLVVRLEEHPVFDRLGFDVEVRVLVPQMAL
jgi:hypothetical protein